MIEHTSLKNVCFALCNEIQDCLEFWIPCHGFWDTVLDCQLNVSHLCLFFLHQENTFEAAEENMDNDKPPQSPGSRQSSGQEAVWIPGKNQVETVMKPGRCKCSTKSAQEVDHYVKILNTVEFFSRLLFPIVFIFLNIAYWLYYGGILE